MNPIPVTWCLAGAAGVGLLGFFGGMTVKGWQRDSLDLAALRDEREELAKVRRGIAAAATSFEKEREIAATNTTIRDTTIREVFKDRPVPADCAVPAGAARVLDDAIADANARARGEPSSALPLDPGAP